MLIHPTITRRKYDSAAETRSSNKRLRCPFAVSSRDASTTSDLQYLRYRSIGESVVGGVASWQILPKSTVTVEAAALTAIFPRARAAARAVFVAAELDTYKFFGKGSDTATPHLSDVRHLSQGLHLVVQQDILHSLKLSVLPNAINLRLCQRERGNRLAQELFVHGSVQQFRAAFHAEPLFLQCSSSSTFLQLGRANVHLASKSWPRRLGPDVLVNECELVCDNAPTT